MEQDMKLFYDIAYTAIEQEDINLRKLFNHSENNKKLYNDEHNGICCLYETTFVYLIFKALMENDFKYRAVWEQSYQKNKKEKCDLVLEEKIENTESNKNKTKALIEFKIWNTESSYAIHQDIAKLRAETSVDNKYIFIIEYGGTPKDDLIKEDLENGGTGILLVDRPRSFTTNYRYGKEKIEGNSINVYMYKV